MSVFSCPGVGNFPAYSGNAGSTRNNPDYVAVPDVGPLPTGIYYIVAMPGTAYTRLKEALTYPHAYLWTGSDHTTWLALYRRDEKIDDETFIGNVRRGNFRLHAAGYKGISKGCITFPSTSNYMKVYKALLKTPTFHVTPSLKAYGTVLVYK